jgi:hypothetical protein
MRTAYDFAERRLRELNVPTTIRAGNSNVFTFFRHHKNSRRKPGIKQNTSNEHKKLKWARAGGYTYSITAGKASPEASEPSGIS